MRILISGVGDVGFHLARLLSLEEHHITVIDLDEEKLERVDAVSEVLRIRGSATSIEDLRAARVSEADLVLAVTSTEEVNITTAMLAKKLGAKKTLARVSNPEYVAIDCPIDFKEVGIDHVIYPEELSAIEIVKLIERAAATDIHDFEDGKLTLIGMRLDKRAPIVRKRILEVIQQLDESVSFRIVLMKRGGKTFIPTRDEKLRPGDQLIMMTRPEGLPAILKLMGKERTKFKNIMILGGGKIGRACARYLQDRFHIKLIESSQEKAMELADILPRSLIIHGDGRDINLLNDERVKDMDAFIAVSDDAETNIISCLLARELGVNKTIAYVETAEYTQLTQTVGIDALINKKLITANNINRFIRKTDIVALTNIQGMDAEVLEFVVPHGSRITKSPVKSLKFPRGAIIGGVIRGDEAFIAVGDTLIKGDDRVVVFILPGRIKKVEEFFSR